MRAHKSWKKTYKQQLFQQIVNGFGWIFHKCTALTRTIFFTIWEAPREEKKWLSHYLHHRIKCDMCTEALPWWRRQIQFMNSSNQSFRDTVINQIPSLKRRTNATGSESEHFEFSWINWNFILYFRSYSKMRMKLWHFFQNSFFPSYPAFVYAHFFPSIY